MEKEGPGSKVIGITETIGEHTRRGRITTLGLGRRLANEVFSKDKSNNVPLSGPPIIISVANPRTPKKS